MPPKNKKEQEEEARRLEEEQKRREEEEARLTEERRKYAVEVLPSGLKLPISEQLLVDLNTTPLQSITEKVTYNLLEITPQLQQQPKIKELVERELIQYALQGLKSFQAGQQQHKKIRLLVGIALRLMLEGHEAVGGSGKDRQKDETLLRTLLKAEAEDGGSLQLADMKKIVECLRKAYFGHYTLLWNHSHFAKRQDTIEQFVYLSAHQAPRNSKDTPFVDLAPPPAQPEEQAPPEATE